MSQAAVVRAHYSLRCNYLAEFTVQTRMCIRV